VNVNDNKLGFRGTYLPNAGVIMLQKTHTEATPPKDFSLNFDVCILSIYLMKITRSTLLF
jgi:hypothetical protein